MIRGFFKSISRKGVLGINNRNANFTLKYNPRYLYPVVDDKLRTKELAIKSGMAAPELYGVIEKYSQIRNIHELLKKHEEFVIKPAAGSGGDGIIVIAGRAKNLYRKVSGLLISGEELNYHISNTLSGLYSLGGESDKVLIEYRVQSDPVFEKISYLGVPDIRIIVFLGVPVMAMVRLPTRMSDGKANLHQGAIGAGIDIMAGTTTTGVWRNDSVSEHPDTGNPISGVAIHRWSALLELAIQCYELTGLGYQGVDIVLDQNKGPMILEINARPGLNIQIANQRGLLPRLRLVERYHKTLSTVKERISFAREHFKVNN